MDSAADSSSPPLAPVAVDALAPASASDHPSPPHHPPVTSPGAASRVKLMVSYGGRIQPRPHDSTRLAYVGGETKILALDRSARLPALLAKVASVAPSAPDPLCLKYQLPGEDLDSLVSVTDDDDLEHMMVEYDRLQRSNSSTSPKTAARLRLFLFPVGPPPPPPSAALLDSARAERQWFLDALNAVPVPTLQTQPSPGKMMPSPDFLFGLDEGFVPPPAVKVAVDEKPQFAHENLPLEPPVKLDPVKDEPGQQIGGGADLPATAQVAVSAMDIQQQIPEPQKLQVAKTPPSPLIPRNGSEETLQRVHPADYHVQPPPEMAAPAVAQWSDTGGRYASLAPGHDQMVYLLQASPGFYPGFYAAPPRMPPAEAYRDAAAKAAGGGAEAYAAAAAVGGGKLAYDGAGRVVYYASMMPTYGTVTSVALNPVDAAVKAAKPSQIA